MSLVFSKSETYCLNMTKTGLIQKRLSHSDNVVGDWFTLACVKLFQLRLDESLTYTPLGQL